MREVDSTPLMSLANLTPEEGAKTIAQGKQFDLDPDVITNKTVNINEMIDSASIPSRFPPILAESINSRSMASLVKPDADKLSYIERQIGNLKTTLELGDVGRRRNQKAFETMIYGKNEDRSFELVGLQDDAETLEADKKKFDIGFAEGIPADVVNVGADLGRSLIDEWKISTSLTAAGAAGGAALGFLTPFPGATATVAGAGALSGLAMGMRVSMFKDSFSQSSGSIYSELTFGSKESIDANGNKISTPHNVSEKDKRAMALGAGLMMAGLDLAGQKVLEKTIPALGKVLNPKVFAKFISKPGNEMWADTARKLGSSEFVKLYLTSMGGEGGTEALQELTEIVAVNIATSEKQKSGSAFLDGFAQLTTDDAVRVLKAGTVGAVAGGSLTAVGRGVDRAINAGVKAYKNRNGDSVSIDPEVDATGTDATPIMEKLQEGLPTAQQQAVDRQAANPLKRRLGLVDGVPQGITTQGSKGIALAMAIEELSKLTGSTKLQELAPDEMNTLIQRQAEAHGVGSVEADPEGLTEWANTQEKADMLAPFLEGVEPGMSTPIRLNMSDVIQIVQKYPDFVSFVKDQPEGVTHNEYKKIIESRKKAADDILQRNTRSVETAVQENVDQTDSISQAEEILTQQEISPRELTPGEQTLVDARGDIYLKDIKNKKLSDSQLADLVVTRERAQFVLDELQGEIDDIKAGNDIEIAAQARTPQELEAAVREAKPGKAKIKDGRTVEFIPSVQSNGVPVVTAMIDGKLAGSVRMHLERQNGQNVTTPAMTHVEKDFRRKGVATAMYEYIRENVVRLEHSNIQLPDGKAFAQGSRKKGTGVFKVPDTEKLDAIKNRLQLLKPNLPTYNDGRLRDSDIHSEQQFLNQSIFTKPIEGSLTQAEVDRANEAVMSARLERVEAIDQAADTEWTEVVDYQTKIIEQADREQAAIDMEANPDIQVVENFLNDRIIGIPSEKMLANQAKGLPLVQINPNTLNSSIRGKFQNDPVLKTRKVFNDKGVNIQDAVKMFGVETPEQLLTILSTVPDQETSFKNAEAIRAPETRAEAEFAIDLNEAAISKFYEKEVSNHWNELKILKDKSWKTLTGLIKRIALPLKSIPEYQAKARTAIAGTPVKFLNAKRYIIGEGKAQAKALKDVLEAKFESAFANKQAVILNALLAKESMIAIKAVNIANKKLAAMLSQATQKQLAKAGKSYIDAFNYISGTFNFDPSKKGTITEDQYKKFQEQMIREGRGDVRIPDGLAEKLSGKVNARDLTFDEYIFLVNKMYSIVQQARRKNQLELLEKTKNENTNTHLLRDSVKFNLEKNNKYDVNRPIAGLRPKNEQERVGAWLSGGFLTTKNLQALTIILDNGKKDGYFSRLFFDYLMGTGRFNDGINGQSAAVEWRAKLQNSFRAAIKDYGKAKYFKMHDKIMFVPEFAQYQSLNNGKVTKHDLFEMQKHMGNEENRNRLENFGVPISIIEQVLQRELTDEDVDFIQTNIWDRYENEIKPRLAAKERITNGSEPQWTINRGFTRDSGKEFRGGHYPIKYKIVDSGKAATDKLKKEIEAANGESIIGVSDHQPLHGIVRSPHTKERVGSQYPLDLGVTITQQGFEDVIYDITMREPVKEIMDMLADKSIAEDIQRVLGVEGYNLLVNYVSEATRSYNSKQIDLYNAQAKWMGNVVDTIHTGHAVGAIALNIGSVLIQFASFRYVVDALGPDGKRYLAHTAQKMLNPANWKNWGKYLEQAKVMSPSLRAYQEGLDAQSLNGIREMSPRDRAFKSSMAAIRVPYNGLRTTQEATIKLAFDGILAGTDNMMKVVALNAFYSQHLAGDAPDQDVNLWEKQTPEQREVDAQAYANKMITGTLTAGTQIDRAAIQKTALGQLVTRYWNDSRNALNYNLQKASNYKRDLEDASKAAKAGDFQKFHEKFTGVGEDLLRVVILSTVASVFTESVRGLFWTDDEEESKFKPKEDESPAGYAARQSYSLFVENFGQHIPGARSLFFAVENAIKNNGQIKSNEVIGQTLDDLGTVGKMLFYDIGYGTMNDLTFAETLEGIQEHQWKAFAKTMSIATGGIPVNFGHQLYKLGTDEDLQGKYKIKQAAGAVLGPVVEFLKGFIDRNDETQDERFERLMKQAEDEESGKVNSGSAMPVIVDNTKSVVTNITSENKEDLTDDEYYLFKMAESGDDPTARPKKYEFDESLGKNVWTGEYASNAFGYYQFTKTAWEDVMNFAPKSAGLTKKGRTEETGEQQEIAIKYWVKMIIKDFKKAKVKIPVTTENIYGAHHFGREGWIKVMEAKESKTVASVLGQDVIDANPKLERKEYKTIKGLKQYIADQLEISRKKIDNSEIANN